MDEKGHDLYRKYQARAILVTVESKPFDVHAFLVMMCWTVEIEVSEELRS